MHACGQDVTLETSSTCFIIPRSVPCIFLITKLARVPRFAPPPHRGASTAGTDTPISSSDRAPHPRQLAPCKVIRFDLRDCGPPRGHAQQPSRHFSEASEFLGMHDHQRCKRKQLARGLSSILRLPSSQEPPSLHDHQSPAV